LALKVVYKQDEPIPKAIASIYINPGYGSSFEIAKDVFLSTKMGTLMSTF
jgi:hypothetical protein